MGDPKRQKKHYERPKKLWDKAKVEERRRIVETYGLKNKKEIWKSETFLRRKRENARKLLAQPFEARKQREKELLDCLIENGVLKNNAALDDVLGLKVEAILERRLETLVWKQGLSATLTQARQLITHGHIGISGKKMTAPGYVVKRDEESKISFLDKALEIKIKKAAQKKKEIKPKIPEKAPEAPKAATTAIVPEEEKLPAPVLEIAEKEIEKTPEETAKKEKAGAAKPAKKEKPKEKKEAKPEGEGK